MRACFIDFESFFRDDSDTGRLINKLIGTSI